MGFQEISDSRAERLPPWWLAAPALAQRIARLPISDDGAWYRLGDGLLGLRSDDEPLLERFRSLFGACAARPPAPDYSLRVCCAVRSLATPAVALATFEDPEPLDQAAFAAGVFAGLGVTEMPSPIPPWRLLRLPGSSPAGVAACAKDRLLIDRHGPWQAFVANLAINRVLRLQRDVAFFHAGCVGVAGRGVLLSGAKASGKTTLSLALAARGHDLLGEEIAGVRLRTLELVPVRRAASLRPGPRARAVDRALQGAAATVERFPDGSARLRADIDGLFPAPRTPLRLSGAVFLRRLTARPRLEPFTAARQHLGLLAPLGASLWGSPPAARAVQLLAVLARVRCWFLDAGPPDETAALLEAAMEG